MNHPESNQVFISNFAAAIYLMKTVEICLEAAADSARHPEIKKRVANFHVRARNHRLDVMLKLRGDTVRWIQDDLQSEDLQALASIVLTILEKPGIANIEDETIAAIRAIRNNLSK
jgi:aspartyl/asparaginyl-tRNA synthetase